ncbi:Zn-ribbon domain-containing OB-fold protein [Mycobacterium sp. 050134]|uniref:Zn-ribbon domain-containing OB-fold protein n=1 Tax=Mycobacterium sp. 050134 TaxID=3096111 RepID=UPI002EDA4B3D
MTQVAAIGTYRPPWIAGGRRVRGPDEDAVTMAVAAGRAALAGTLARRVVLVSRNFPLIEGGNGAVLLAGLGLSGDTTITEVLGGAPAVLDQIVAATPGTLVIAADDDDRYAGAAALLTGDAGPALDPVGRVTRSLPMTARADDGSRHDYADPRLQREVGVRASFASLGVPAGAAVAVVAGAKPVVLGVEPNTSSASADSTTAGSVLIALIADALDAGTTGLVVAVENATISVAELTAAGAPVRVARDEVEARDLPRAKIAEGTGIPISLPAYARAFEPKIRWEAAVFDERPGVDGNPQFPPRRRVDESGTLAAQYRLEPLPRTGTVYTHTTVRIPVPDLPGPYSLAVVALDNSPVRVLLKVTGIPAGEVTIGQPGAVVLRKVATRAGVPDYGYMFWPGRPAEEVLA